MISDEAIFRFYWYKFVVGKGLIYFNYHEFPDKYKKRIKNLLGYRQFLLSIRCYLLKKEIWKVIKPIMDRIKSLIST